MMTALDLNSWFLHSRLRKLERGLVVASIVALIVYAMS